MERSWLETEEGREVLLDLQNVPNIRQLLIECGKTHNQSLINQLLDSSVRDPEKDRAFIVNKAELDGARSMLKFLVDRVEEAGRPRKNK